MYCKFDELAKLDRALDDFDNLRMFSIIWICRTVSLMICISLG